MNEFLTEEEKVGRNGSRKGEQRRKMLRNTATRMEKHL